MFAPPKVASLAMLQASSNLCQSVKSVVSNSEFGFNPSPNKTITCNVFQFLHGHRGLRARLSLFSPVGFVRHERVAERVRFTQIPGIHRID